MTKVYLVYMNGIDVNGKNQKNIWAVFTNKRKAQIYCKYKEEVTGENWLTTMKMQRVEWKVEEERIWTEDFSTKLNQIQMKKLPF